MKRVLVIGGLDPSGIAGISADIRALSTLDVIVAPVTTGIVLENSEKVDEIIPHDPRLVARAIRCAVDDGEPSAAKLGMLYSPECAKAVARELEDLECPIVVDPVLSASVGTRLADAGLPDALVEHVFSVADLVTPNARELEALSGMKVGNLQAAEKAANSLMIRGGPGAILVKGGHLRGKLAADLLVEPKRVTEFASPRLSLEGLRGLGCTYASLIAGYLAMGEGLRDSIGQAKDVLHTSLEMAQPIGSALALNPMNRVVSGSEKYKIMEEIRAALPELLNAFVPKLMPEVGNNLAYALWGATSVSDVCGLDSRIVLKGDRAASVGTPAFGASRHMSRVVLTTIQYDPAVRCVLNLKYSKEVVAAAKKVGLTEASFDRKDEPKSVKTMAWGTAKAIQDKGFVPDMIWDAGGHGKEAMVRLLGRNPADLVYKVRQIARWL
ncbi:MAG: bifunctional hydroxymethylpyrimidine kinase/phosphomethylpyrimidine kinase [Methanobacteriota archaeon]